MAEIEFNVLNGHCLNRRMDNIYTVKQEVEVWKDHRNDKNFVSNWRFETKEARILWKRLYAPIKGDVTFVIDGLNTHEPGLLDEAFEPKEAKRIWDRFEFVFTLKHGRWLNMAEIVLNVLNSNV